MRADELKKRYRMGEHEENGLYLERHFPYTGKDRAASGSTLYYVPQRGYTEFHRIDCDEYWCFNAGAVLELWKIDETGVLSKSLFGTDEGAEPLAYFPKGTIFASRQPDDSDDGTFFTCITVPRFDYSGFELLKREDVTAINPAAAAFWEKTDNGKEFV